MRECIVYTCMCECIFARTSVCARMCVCVHVGVYLGMLMAHKTTVCAEIAGCFVKIYSIFIPVKQRGTIGVPTQNAYQIEYSEK